MRNNEDKKKFLETLEEIPLISVAAKRCGIHRSTIYRWQKDDAFDQKLNKALGKGRDHLNDMAEGQLVGQIRKGEFRAIRYWLDNNNKRYIKPRTPIAYDEKKIEKIIVKFVDYSGEKDDPKKSNQEIDRINDDENIV